MPFKVVLDANVLYPFHLRDLLLRLAERELYVPYLSHRILDEMARNLVKNHPDQIPRAKADRLVEIIKDAFEEAIVDASAIGALETAMTNDPGDRHVLAAAVAAGAEAIVSFDHRHFPPTALEPHGCVLIGPQEFLCDLLARHEAVVVEELTAAAAALRSPPRSRDDLLNALRRTGLVEFANLLDAAIHR